MSKWHYVAIGILSIYYGIYSAAEAEVYWPLKIFLVGPLVLFWGLLWLAIFYVAVRWLWPRRNGIAKALGLIVAAPLVAIWMWIVTDRELGGGWRR